MTMAMQATIMDPMRSPDRALRVLIVEDELLVAWHLESLIREQSLEVCGLVPDGDGAVEQASDLDVRNGRLADVIVQSADDLFRPQWDSTRDTYPPPLVPEH